MRIVQPSVELVWITPNPAQVIEFAARKCYKSEDKYDPTKTAQFLDKIVNQYHHESIVEHGCASIDVVCDRGVGNEWVRHRIASYSQESTRYCNYSKDRHGNEILVIKPPGIEKCDKDLGAFVLCSCEKCKVYSAWESAVKAAEHSYFALIKAGQSPQIARSVLPLCLKTEFRVTANFRSWMNFIELRCAPGAHPQIRELAVQVKAILQRECPEIFGQPQSSV